MDNDNYFKKEKLNYSNLDLAIEELKILFSIISRHDDLSFKIKKWAITINSALIIGIASGKITEYIANNYLILFLPVLPLIFLWIDVIHRVAMDRAIKRQADVEECVRNNNNYDGPKIDMTLSKPNSFKDQMKALNNVRMYFIYLILVISIIITIIFS